jgi:uncharacterized protein (TIGR03083 family)
VLIRRRRLVLSAPVATVAVVTIDYLAHLRADSARFAEVLANTDPAARVPSCPDWNAADLVWHLAEVQLFWAAIVRDRLDDPDAAEAGKPERPDDYDALLRLFGRASGALADALDATPDDVGIWTWFPPEQNAGFVRRRQAHEAVIHRLDAELTADAVTHYDPALATDGVREVLECMYSGAPDWATHVVDGPVGRVATTDTGGEWFVQLGRWSGHSPNTGKDYTDEPLLVLVDGGDPVFTVAGSAGDLDAWLWNRPTAGEVRREGDVAGFEAVIRSGVQ